MTGPYGALYHVSMTESPERSPHDLLVAWERVLLSDKEGHLLYLGSLVKRGDLEKIISYQPSFKKWTQDWEQFKKAHKEMYTYDWSPV